MGKVRRRKLLVHDDILMRLGENKSSGLHRALSKFYGFLQFGSKFGDGFGGVGFVLPLQDCFEVVIAQARQSNGCAFNVYPGLVDEMIPLANPKCRGLGSKLAAVVW